MNRKSILISTIGFSIVASGFFLWWMIAEQTRPEQQANKDIAKVGLSRSAQNWAKRLRDSDADEHSEQLNTAWEEIKTDRQRGKITSSDDLALAEIYQKTLAAGRKATGSALAGEEHSGKAMPFVARLSPTQKRRGDDRIVYQLGEGITSPRLVAKTTPAYTPEGLKANVQGTVYLQAIIHDDGRVDSFKVLRGLGYGLEEKAIQEIANSWRFAPALKEGRPVNVQVYIEAQYKIP